MADTTLYAGKDRLAILKEIEDGVDPNEETYSESVNDDNDNLDPEEGSFKKRYGDLRRYHQETQAEYKRRIEQLEDQLNEVKKSGLPQLRSDEEIEAFANANPDAYSLVLSLAAKQAKPLEDELTSVREKLREQEEALVLERAVAEIKKEHPDYDEIRTSQEFHDWVGEQPPSIQSWIYDNTNSAEGAKKALKLYKLETGKTTNTRNDRRSLREIQNDAASNPKLNGRSSPSDGKRIYKESEIQNMPVHMYEKLEDDIDAAAREGRILLGE
jgi:hypothetical protein